MVICDALGLAFIHIPKCAGTTIRRGLAPFDSYPLDGYFDFPDGGRQHLHHLPLWVVKRYFPALYSKLESYDSYAVLREPRERFASALLQHLRSFQKLSLTRNDIGIFQHKGRELCRWLASTGSARVPELMHFLPQRDFLVCDGVEVVRHLHRFDKLILLVEDLRRRHGITLDLRSRANLARTGNHPATQLVWRSGRVIINATMTHAGRQRLRTALHAMGVNSPKALYVGLYEDRQVAAFVDGYYARDAELYHRLTMK